MINDTYLDKTEMLMCEYVAMLRDRKMAGVPDQLPSEAMSDQRQYGVWGEFVFAKIHQVFFYADESTLPWDVMYRGWCIDVKCSPHPNLAVNPHRIKEGVDCFANVQHLGGNHFRYTGAISKERMLKRYDPQPNKHGDCYLVPMSDLILDIPMSTPQGTKEKTNEVSTEQRQRHSARKPH